MTEKVVWRVGREYARASGIATIAPHDLLRSRERLCHLAGGESNQIQFLLDTSQFQLRSATSAANNESRLPSMIAWESSQRPEDLCAHLANCRRFGVTLSGNTLLFNVMHAIRRTVSPTS